MIFAENQEKMNPTYLRTCFQPDKSYFILVMTKEVEAHESISHWTLTKSSGVKIKHKNNDGKLKNILFIWSFKHKRFTDGG